MVKTTLIVALSVFLSGCFFQKKQISVEKLRQRFPDYGLAKTGSIGDKDLKIETFSGSYDGRVLDIQVRTPVEKTKALEAMVQERHRFESVFQVQRLPYPGSVTQTSDCPGRTNPAIEILDLQNGGPRLSVKVATNARFVFGGCGESEQVYDLMELMFHCEKEAALVTGKMYVRRGKNVDNTKFAELNCVGLAG